MRATKDSGVEWLGEIPEDWLVKPLKRNTYIKARVGWKGLTSDEFEVESFAYLVTGRDFSSKVIDFSECYQVSQERYLDDPFIQLKQGDILITKDGTIGKTAWVNELDKPACLNSGIFVVRPKADYVSEFLFWVLESAVFKEFIRLVSSGSTIQHLYQNVFENFSFGIPPVEEQRLIADFLDRETAKIDALIAKQEELITTLDERRGAVISRAVTRGLVEGRPIRDSGVEWLGQIPIDWKTGRIRNVLAGPIVDGPHETPVFGDEGFPFLSVDAIQDGELVLEGCRLIDEHSFNEYRRKASPKLGDILMGKAASTGKIAMVKLETEFAIWSPLALIRVNSRKFEPRFVEYSLKSSHSQAEIDTLCTSNTQKNISMGDIPRISISIPPLAEQKKISDFLDQETDQISQSKNQASRMKGLLLERRQALISAAVTGKLEVGV